MLVNIADAAKRRSIPLSIWVIACISLSFWYLYITPSVFTATTTIILDPRRQTVGLGSDSNAIASLPSLDTAQAESQIQVIRSERLLANVFDSLDLIQNAEFSPSNRRSSLAIIRDFFDRRQEKLPSDMLDVSPDRYAFNRFADRVIAKRVGQSYVIEVSYTSSSPVQAAKLANSIVSAYLLQQLTFKLAAAQNGAEYLQGRINSLSSQVKVASDGMKAGLTPTILLPDADARVIGSAREPLTRSAPKAGLVVSFAIFFGLFSGLFAVTIISSIDKKIYTLNQLESGFNLRCLGVVPDILRRKISFRRTNSSSFFHSIEFPSGAFATTIRQIRTSILLSFHNKKTVSFGIVSSSSSLVGSIISSNLAAVISTSNTKVLLIDSDITNNRSNFTFLSSDPSFTLSHYLSTEEMPEENVNLQVINNFDFLPASSGHSAKNYNTYLGSAAMERLISHYKQIGDVMVHIPLSSVPVDGRALAALLDGVIIIIESGKTTSDELSRTISTLADTSTKILGLVLVH